MKAVPKIEDLVGVHAGKVTLEEMRKELDEMRSHDAREAAEEIDRIRSDTRGEAWSGVKEIRKWRDRTQ